MKRSRRFSFGTAQVLACGLVPGLLTDAISAQAAVKGWLSWRGPQQNGMSIERNLPEKIPNKEAALWVADFPGQSTSVVANGKVYIMGYLGDGADMQEGVACFDAETGQKLWER